MASLNVPMPDDLREYLNERAKRGGFSTPSEYVRQLIREDRGREADRQLEELLIEGLESGQAREWTPAVREALRKDIRSKRAIGRSGDARKKKRSAS